MISTERLELTELQEQDAEFIFALLNDPGWIRYIGDRGIKNLEDATNYIITGPQASYKQFGFGLYKVTRQTDQVPIGLCGLLKRPHLNHPDIGFAFLGSFGGQGYALEASEAIMQEAKLKHQCEAVLAVTLPENEKSIKLLKKLGMRLVGETRMSEDGEALHLFST